MVRPCAEDRILAAVTELAGQRGYAHLTVERLLEEAGVSRASFYRYYANLDDAFATAYRHHADDLLAGVLSSVKHAECPHAAMVRVLSEVANARPDSAQLLLAEGLAAGPAGLRERHALVARLDSAIPRRGAGQARIDLPAKVLIGGVLRFLSMGFADGASTAPIDEILSWAAAFERPAYRRYWSVTLAPEVPTASAAQAAAGQMHRRGTPRERILHATAACIRHSGYRVTSVAGIVSAARVSRRSFYNEFASKQAACIAAYELGFQQTMAACAPAFFSADEWHERVWQSALAFTSYFAREPSLAYLGFVECHALGREFASRVRQTQLAFTLFLEEGYRQSQGSDGPPRICSPLSAAVIAEIGFLATCASPSLYLRRMQPLAVYVALTPFVGSEEAGRLVSEKISEPAGGSSAGP